MLTNYFRCLRHRVISQSATLSRRRSHLTGCNLEDICPSVVDHIWWHNIFSRPSRTEVSANWPLTNGIHTLAPWMRLLRKWGTGTNYTLYSRLIWNLKFHWSRLACLTDIKQTSYAVRFEDTPQLFKFRSPDLSSAPWSWFWFCF